MTIRRPPVLIAATVAAFLSLVTGCMPEAAAPVAKGPIDTSVASQLQARTRSKNGEKYSVTHQYKDQEFTANWELSNALKKSSQLQIKPPADWEPSDLYQALEIVLNGHATKPWYPAIDDTVLKLMREALKADDNRATGFAPETPYDVAVKVKQHTSEWFLEVKVQILNEDGTAIGF
jgi:hypothetical protein